MGIGAFLAFFAPLSAIFAALKLVDLQRSAKNAESSPKNAKGFRVISAVIEPHSRLLLYNSKNYQVFFDTLKSFSLRPGGPRDCAGAVFAAC